MTMGDSETVVAQTSAVKDFSTAGYSSTDYGNTSLTAASDATAFANGVTGEMDTTTSTTTSDIALPNSVADEGGSIEVGEGRSTMDLDPRQSYDTTENLPSTVNNSMDSSQAGSDTYTAMTAVSENGNPSDDIQGSASAQQLPDGSALSVEEERIWSIVRANSLDFNAWTALIDETEKVAEPNILKIRKVYDAFLAEFPLCYGYWKKYADHEAHFGSIDKVVEVYERAVQGVTYSVDMWLHYCIFATGTYGDADTVRRLFERGLEYVGTDYQSYTLWDKYIEYEYMQQEWSRLASIYTRILENPIQQLDRYFNSFKELAGSRPLSELRTSEEAAAAAALNLESRDQETEGETNPNDVAQSSEHASASSTEAEELEKYISVREEMYKKAKEFDSKIVGFEAVIRRPYFHVRPLNVPELENWHNYLEFIEGVGDLNKVSSYFLTIYLSAKEGPSFVFEGPPRFVNGIVKLYERCLIACANYPEFWTRYVLCMEASGCMDLANNALTRATQVFVKRQPEIHLFAARFKEHNEDIHGARAAYQLLHSEISPGLLEAISKHANMEHRLGNLEDACSVYEQAIAVEKGKEQSQALPYLFAQYSRFLHLVSNNAEKARELLVQAVEGVQLSKPLLEALIHLESILPSPKQIEYLDSLVDKFIVPIHDSSSVASISEREDISCIYLEFLDLFGDAKAIKKADDRHSKLFLHHKSTPESKKRSADDSLTSDKTKLAKSQSGVPVSVPSVMGAYPSAQSHWGAGYAMQPQTWPQVTQAQGQQYPGYAPQAAYGAYGAYGSSYAHPQVPAAVPQAAAYGAYPPPYPTQGIPQQAYAQPATSAVLTPAQQPATVPTQQPYYGSSYY